MEGNLLLLQVVDGVDDEHRLSEGGQRVGPFPKRVAYGFGYECAVCQLQAEAGKGGEEGQLHGVQVQPGMQTLIGGFDHDRGKFFRCENKVDGQGYSGCQQYNQRAKSDEADAQSLFEGCFHSSVSLPCCSFN